MKQESVALQTIFDDKMKQNEELLIRLQLKNPNTSANSNGTVSMDLNALRE